MLGPRLGPVISSHPPVSPSTHLSRPQSVARRNSHARLDSDAASVSSNSDAESRNVRVVLRVRPSNPDDAHIPPRFQNTLVHPTSSSSVRVDVDPAMLAGQVNGTVNGASKRHPTFSFDQVLGEGSSQVDLYDVTGKEVLEDFMYGHNVTFLAYGQTSSGKSYSMGTTGDEPDYSSIEFNPRTGLIPRTVQSIFERAEDIRNSSGLGASWECRISFLELYNEEIIDLLSGSGVSISIREERDGRIIWSGVREVKVKSLMEVMQLLQDGSARRRTGETEMNATSSRSHAIFSLTLVQKRRAGIIASSSQPIPQDTPTRVLKRPTSTVGFSGGSRSTTPSGRSPTPSGSRNGAPPTSFNGLQRPGLPRPSSMHIASTIADSEWTVVTSKFNMVDLAGSERLKRTAAQGDRMKEGISINSGLLALGNVISTLCDPVKARGHIPYRDSKLTRMLQDSIGGNALTTMIACVSGIEYNIGETLNTMKYASRARNIKNVAKVNAVEAGWDDVEHLQNLVVGLRKQLEAIGMAGRVEMQGNQKEGSHGEKLVQRLDDLQREHTELYDRYLRKYNEHLRLTSELRGARPGDNEALDSFNEAVEPVILEYEKVVSALNEQLDDLRLELTAVNDLSEEQGRQLSVTADRHAQSEGYVMELRSRIVKLTERNASSEGYVHDLESKLKLQSDKSIAAGGTIISLQTEIVALKEANIRLNTHTSQLEGRLSDSETRSTDLTTQILKHEKEADGRERVIRDLESRIASLDATNDRAVLVEELYHQTARIAELEHLSRPNDDMLDTKRAGIRDSANQAELHSRLATSHIASSLEASASTVSFVDAQNIVQPRRHANPEMTPPDSPQSGSPQPGREGEQPMLNDVVQLRAALKTLTARYNEAESRYDQAAAKVTDLTTQLSEAKLIHAEMQDVLPGSPSLPSSSQGDDISERGSILQTPRPSSPTSDSPTRRRGSRRGSLPLVLSTISGVTTTAKRQDFRIGRGFGESKRTRPQSLSQELSSAQSSAISQRTSWGGPSSLLFTSSPGPQGATAQKPLRSPQSLEAELKYVHRIVQERDDELKDRETYIRQLEDVIQQSHSLPSRKSSIMSLLVTPGSSPEPSTIPLPLSPFTPTATHTGDTHIWPSSSTPSPPSVKGISPSIERTERSVKTASVADETHPRVADLMREMVTKEASQRQIIEQQFVQIADLQKANHRLKDELFKTVSIYQAPLKTLAHPNQDHEMPGSFSPHKRTSSPAQKSSQLRNSAAVDRFHDEHAEELQALVKDHAQTVKLLQEEHSEAVDQLYQALTTASENHAQILKYERAAHDSVLAELEHIHAGAHATAQSDHKQIVKELAGSLATGEEQRRQLKMKADQALFELSRVRDEHQVQRSADLRRIADLDQTNVALERIKGELETANNELTRKVWEFELRFNRTAAAVPPQGPPPSTPLPPVPSASTHFFSPGSPSSLRDEKKGDAFPWSANPMPAIPNNTAALAQVPQPVEQVIQQMAAQRDTALTENDFLKTQLEKDEEQCAITAIQLENERGRSETLVKDLKEAHKTNSKLRAHLEDARQETRRVSTACKEHMDELTNRRARMSTLSEETGRHRDSLLAANEQVAVLKAQLDRAVESKVNKKLGQRLKCF